MNKEINSISELVKKALRQTEHKFLRIVNTALIAELTEPERLDYYKRKIVEICDRNDNMAKMLWILRGGADGASEFDRIYDIVTDFYNRIGFSEKITDKEFEDFVFEYVQIIRLKFAIKALSKNKKSGNLTFETMFIPPEYSSIVKERLEINGYTRNGIWCKESTDGQGSLSQIKGAFYSLIDIMVQKPKIKLARAFFGEFGIEVKEKGGDITEKWIRNHPDVKYCEDYQRIFNDLIN